MRKISLEEIKDIELDMVKYLDKICRENNITYFVLGGTLLGAVRHKGFIPWDDDIDVGMPREDFYKFREILKNREDNYKISFFDTDRNYGYAIPKLLDRRTTLIDYKHGHGREESSVFIDIFLFDGMGNTLLTSKLWYYFLKIFKRSVFLSKRNFVMETKLKTAVFAVPWVICHLIGPYRLNKLYNSLASLKKYGGTRFVATASGVYGKREIFRKDVFSETTDLSFEDTELKVPVKYKEYLSSLYGDYMKLPPVEKRVSNHTSEEWWND